MKTLTILSTALAFSFAPFHIISAYADDHDKKDNGQRGGGKPQGGGGKPANRGQIAQRPHVLTPAARRPGPPAHTANAIVAPGNPSAGRSRGARSAQVQAQAPAFVAPNAGPGTRGARSTASLPAAARGSGISSRRNNGQAYPNQSAYNRGNSYGGLWSAGDNHRDWDRNGVHVWNHHRYGWYDGGWLIIDGSFRPSGFAYSDYSSDSTVVQVQRTLMAQGYRLGSADGVIGPATSNAIANYQQDNGLAVTGTINDPLLASLGLE